MSRELRAAIERFEKVADAPTGPMLNTMYMVDDNHDLKSPRTQNMLQILYKKGFIEEKKRGWKLSPKGVEALKDGIQNGLVRTPMGAKVKEDYVVRGT